MIHRRTMTEGEMGETATMAGAVFCRTRMNYVSRGGFGESVEPTEVTVYDGRRAALPGWQTCGFELRKHASALDDWRDDVQIERVHYAEISAFARSLTGCDHALVSGHVKRDPEQAAKHPDLGPIEFVHSDFAESYGTVKAAELRTLPVHNYAGGSFFFETLAVIAPRDASAHRWFAFPDMQRDEVVVFRTFDSDRVAGGETFWTPHSAFADPAVAPGRPSRRSIELRATCLFA
jgi:hypothetical protein